nr:hypothetical protein Iba_chr09bCG8740 [Ipomoea batatas]GMD33912.1 hypothetical protein Iba_chr09cCG7070 [Ipomoea batatas]
MHIVAALCTGSDLNDIAFDAEITSAVAALNMPKETTCVFVRCSGLWICDYFGVPGDTCNCKVPWKGM